jgi:hypothetical protein
MQPTTSQRGYGTAHQAERERWRPTVEAGHATCTRCGKPIDADAPWDLGHNDDRTAWTGPEHPVCNRAAGARTANQRRHRRMTIRDW